MTPSQEARESTTSNEPRADDLGLPTMASPQVVHAALAAQATQEAREYPEMPEPEHECSLAIERPAYTAEQMRSYVDADRKARQQEALDARRYRMKRNIDERNFKESNIYKHSNEALRDMLLDGWRASYDAAIDAAIAKGASHE